VIRIPVALVGLALALALGALATLAARALARPELGPALLPLCAAFGGYVAGRCSLRLPQVPGFSVGLLAVAVRMGLALGMGLDLLAFVMPIGALLEIIAAITGGMIGALAARRAAQMQPDLTPLT
jgi:hypothetical protein